MEYLTLTEVLVPHARLIQRTGGSGGVLNMGRLESALARAQATFGDEGLYPDVWVKAAALMHDLLNNHPFVGGNQRTALTATGIFLELNGRFLVARNEEAAESVLRVIVERSDVDVAAGWRRAHCGACEGA